MKDLPFVNLAQFHITRDPFNIHDYEGYKVLEGMEKYYDDAKTNIDSWFKNFIDSSPEYKELTQNLSFNIDKYREVPEWTVKKIMASHYHIFLKIESDHWYKDIIYFFEMIDFSFGLPPIGIDFFYHSMKDFLENWSDDRIEFPKEKREKLMKFFETSPSPDEPQPIPDISEFYILTQKWVESFPDIPQLSQLKEHFTNQFIPFLFFYDGDYNPYLGIRTF
ncbi:MAG: hypothetical protein KDD99_28150, partial [Bacteroidetes bacterium]|nr:hypothetical protein [Bacteroidota bacterium]